MPRNLDRRVEIMFPLEDSRIRDKALHILKLELEDTVKAHILRTDGTYDRVDRRGKELINSQLQFCEEAVRKARALKPGQDNRVFTPAVPLA
jgi:polyphosphate kinase